MIKLCESMVKDYSRAALGAARGWRFIGELELARALAS